jgi:hypothetical protein
MSEKIDLAVEEKKFETPILYENAKVNVDKYSKLAHKMLTPNTLSEISQNSPRSSRSSQSKLNSMSLVSSPSEKYVANA